MNIFDWYFKQIVTQGQLDWAFDSVQESMHGLSADNKIVGIVDGLTVTEHASPPNKTVDVAGPGTAYDKDGQRCNMPDSLSVVDCAVDEYGTNSNPPTPGNERYISVFIRFKRNLTDPALDGNNITVYTKQLESYELFVRLGAEALAGTAVPPPIMTDAELLVDILVANGFTAITNGDLDFSRREDWLRWDPGLTPGLLPAASYGNAKDAMLDLYEAVNGLAATFPFTFTSTWFDSQDVEGISPPVATVQAAMDAIVYDLAQNDVYGDSAGFKIGGTAQAFDRITEWFGTDSLGQNLWSLAMDLDGHVDGLGLYHNADQITTPALAGTPDSLVGSYLDAQLSELLDLSNARIKTIHPTSTSNPPVLLWRSRAKAADVDVDEATVSLYWLNNGLAIVIGGYMYGDPYQLHPKNAGTGSIAMLYLNNDYAGDGGVPNQGMIWASTLVKTNGDAFGALNKNNWDSWFQIPVSPSLFAGNDGHAPLIEYKPDIPGDIPGGAIYYGAAAIDRANGFGFVVNARWEPNNSRWVRDIPTDPSYAIELSKSGIIFYYKDDGPAFWNLYAWDSEWRFSGDSNNHGRAAITLSGAGVDTVKVALAAWNPDAATRAIVTAAAVTWHSTLNSVVGGDLTLVADATNNWSATPSALYVDEDGAIIVGTSVGLLEAEYGYWYGHVDVDFEP